MILLNRPVSTFVWGRKAVVRLCLAPSVAKTASESIATDCLLVLVSTHAEAPYSYTQWSENALTTAVAAVVRSGTEQASRESVCDHQHRLGPTLRLLYCTEEVHSHELKRPRRWKQF